MKTESLKGNVDKLNFESLESMIWVFAAKCLKHADKPGGAPWCAELLSHEGVLAFKATIPQESAPADCKLERWPPT